VKPKKALLVFNNSINVEQNLDVVLHEKVIGQTEFLGSLKHLRVLSFKMFTLISIYNVCS